MTLHLLLSLLVWFNVISRRGSKRKATLLSGGNGGFLFTSYLRISFEEGCISIGPLIFVFCFYHHRVRENTHTQYSKCQESVGNGGAERNGKPGFGRWKITCAGCYVWQNQKGNEKPRNATLRSKVWRGHRSYLKEKASLFSCLFVCWGVFVGRGDYLSGCFDSIKEMLKAWSQRERLS